MPAREYLTEQINAFLYYCQHCDESHTIGSPCSCCGAAHREQERIYRSYGLIASLQAVEYPRLESYSYNPGWMHHGDNPLQFGMEIELSTPDTHPIYLARQEIPDLDNLVIFKSDGSVAGFEMVTHPMSYDWAMGNFPWQVFPVLEKAGCSVRPRDNGIHVHVSKAGFTSPAHVYRWMKLIYRNSGNVERMARRHANSWAEFTPSHKAGQFKHVYKGKQHNGPREVWVYNSRRDTYCQIDMTALPLDYRPTSSGYARGDDGCYYPVLLEYSYNDLCLSTSLRERVSNGMNESQAFYPRYNDDPTQSCGRYQVINTTNPDTYEVRLFASTTKANEARAALQLCASTVEYTRSLTAHDVIQAHGWEWQTYKTYVQADDTYPELADALDRKVSFTKGQYV